MRSHIWFRILGVLLILIGVFLPREWYDTLPRDWYGTLPKQAALPLPVKGVTLLQFSFILEGLVLIWLSLKQWTFSRFCGFECPKITFASHEESETSPKRSSLWVLAAITLVALCLRLFDLNSDLWLDEILTVVNYANMPVLQVIANYSSSNNHLLNTLLIKLAVLCFGENEWAIRLPAVIFGIATIPAIYWVARLVLSQWASLGVSLLLAVSYHHIFFSQNARGYSAYLFFSLLSSGLFIRGIEEDRARDWILYVVTMFLNFASLLNSGFVFASHILVGGIALLMVKYRGYSPMPLFRRLTGVFIVTAFLGFQLYATALPQIYAFQRAYTSSSAGYWFFSMEFLREMIRGISAGFGTGMLFGALPFLIVGSVGFIILFRRHWAIIMALVMPCILTFAYLIIKGLAFSPRFFLLALLLAILAAVQGIYSFARLVARIVRKRDDIFASRLATMIVLAVCAVSLLSLRYYYSTPKQAYRASIQYLEETRKPGEIVMVIDLAVVGYRYYGKRFGLKEGEDYFFIRSMDDFEAVLSSHGRKPIFLVTTLNRLLRLSQPDLHARIVKEWTLICTYPGTIGDGDILVWDWRQRRQL